MKGPHRFHTVTEWTGNTGSRTRSYERRCDIRADGKPTIPGSSDPAFRGDKARYNPEDLLAANSANFPVEHEPTVAEE